MWMLMLCGGEKQDQGSGLSTMKMSCGEKERVKTHFQNLLHIDGGDESFALFVKLVEALFVPVKQASRSLVIVSFASCSICVQQLNAIKAQCIY